MDSQIKICKCGCGRTDILQNGFCRNHWVKKSNSGSLVERYGPEVAAKIKAKMSEAQKALYANGYVSPCKGKTNWCKGLTKETSEIIAKRSEKIKKVLRNKDWSYRHDPEYRKKVSEAAKKSASNPNDGRHSEEFRKRIAETNHEKILKGIRLGSKGRGFHLQINGDEIYVRSKYERDFALKLSQLGVKFLYEKLKVSYVDDNNVKHIYIVDFYLPEFNAAIEIKGGYPWEDVNLIYLKKKAVLESGYKYILFDYRSFDGNPEPSQILQRILEGAETIPEGSRLEKISQVEAPDPQSSLAEVMI